ncbi:MAG: hypothetical protein H6822_13195 [Planctomycetaceae bacterium]|nr:hypothetical protein [Planctomycetales bacterium]MCB9923134.1 hypothetical protein [Planctomycetaceae bacterium]
MRILTLIVISILLQANWSSGGEDAGQSIFADSHRDAPAVSYESAGGGVIINGNYLPAPYRITVVPDGIEVNGQFVPQEGFNDRGRRNREPQSDIPFAARVCNRLEEGAWLLGWEEGGYGIMGEARFMDVVATLESESADNVKVEGLESLGSRWIRRADWRELVARWDLPASIVDQLLVAYQEEFAADPELVAAIGAPYRRFHTSIYLLTVFGIGATVFALGTLLSYRPIEKMSWSNVNLSKDATHLVLRSVILLIGLAVLDLVCTTISAQTTSFWELNPLGAAALHSPFVLGAFKIGATLMSGAILLSLRRYHGAQVAAWWLALFCTILAIRWVTFNSMFLA